MKHYKTKILDAENFRSIERCARIIRKGGVVAFPTETVYGLGANALDESSVSSIFSIKGRPEDNPLIVHVSSVECALQLARNVPDTFESLTRKYWPGSLTLIVQKSNIVPDNVTAGLDTVALRMPAHPAALALIQTFGGPIAAPSANPSGKPSPTKAVHVLNDIGGKIPYIIDGGDCLVGIESTVLDISGDTPRVLRPGFIQFEWLQGILGAVDIADASATDAADTGAQADETPMSPGMKYRHYAPKAPLTAVTGLPEATAEYITQHINDNTAALMFDDYALPHKNVVTFGSSGDYNAQASRLFDALRTLDSMDTSAIFAQLPNDEGMGLAVANRIKKAAGQNILTIE